MRKWINLLTELSINDFGGGDGHSQTVLAYDIDWDTDGEEVEDLPSEMTVEVEGDNDDVIREEIADSLSDITGFCVNSFQYRFI